MEILEHKSFFIFFIFVRTNSHKVVVFCGWSLNNGLISDICLRRETTRLLQHLPIITTHYFVISLEKFPEKKYSTNKKRVKWEQVHFLLTRFEVKWICV